MSDLFGMTWLTDTDNGRMDAYNAVLWGLYPDLNYYFTPTIFIHAEPRPMQPAEYDRLVARIRDIEG